VSRLKAHGIINGWVGYGVRVAKHCDLEHEHRANDCPACPGVIHGTIMKRADPDRLMIMVQWDNVPLPRLERRYELNQVSK
jgi:hypothetical protein